MLRCHRLAQPARPAGRETGLCGTGCAIRAVQVTDPFDRSPLSVPSREVHERSTAGTSQVSKRSAETGVAPASRKQVYSWPVVAFCTHPQTSQARPAGPRGQSKAVPNINSVLTTAADPNGPCLGQTLDLPVIFPEPDGLLTEDGGHRNRGASGSVKRPLPLLRPERSAQNASPSRVHDRGRCPLYVRAQLETAGLPWTQWDLAAQKATARETGNSQLTGRFRR